MIKYPTRGLFFYQTVCTHVSKYTFCKNIVPYFLYYRCGNSSRRYYGNTILWSNVATRFYDLSLNQGFTSQFLVPGFPEALNRISNCRLKMQEKRKSFFYAED